MKGTNSMFDIIIIGSGPAGLSAAIYAKRANLNVAVAEKEYEGTGQIAESGNVNNYLGLPNINGYDLGEKKKQLSGASQYKRIRPGRKIQGACSVS